MAIWAVRVKEIRALHLVAEDRSPRLRLKSQVLQRRNGRGVNRKQRQSAYASKLRKPSRGDGLSAKRKKRGIESLKSSDGKKRREETGRKRDFV